jgi:hypothetical protein
MSHIMSHLLTIVFGKISSLRLFCTSVYNEGSHANESLVDLLQDWAKLCKHIAPVIMISQN